MLSKLRRPSSASDCEDSNRQLKEETWSYANVKDVSKLKSEMIEESTVIVKNNRSFVAVKRLRFSKGATFENISQLTLLSENGETETSRKAHRR